MRPKRKDHADFLDAICDVSMERKINVEIYKKKKDKSLFCYMNLSHNQ